MDTITEDGRSSTDKPRNLKDSFEGRRKGGADALVLALEQSLSYVIGQEEATTRGPLR